MRTLSTINYLGSNMGFPLLFLILVALMSGCSSAITENEIKYTQLDMHNAGGDYSGEYEDFIKSTEARTLQHDPTVDLMVKEDGSIATIVDGITVDGRGVVESCEGFHGKCLVIDNYFKLMLPVDFSFSQEKSWEWRGFKYKSIATRNIGILGRNYEVVEIVGYSSDEENKIVKMYVNNSLGLMYFSLAIKDFNSSFFLQSQRGLWSTN